MKKSFISLIFLLVSITCLFTLSFIFITGSYAATSTQTVTYVQSIQPVQGAWYYFERNCFLDFEEYLDGSAPNLTSIGTMDDESVIGVYKADTEIYTDLFGENVTRFPGDIDTSFHNVTEGFNNSNAVYENVTILSNSSCASCEAASITSKNFWVTSSASGVRSGKRVSCEGFCTRTAN